MRFMVNGAVKRHLPYPSLGGCFASNSKGLITAPLISFLLATYLLLCGKSGSLVVWYFGRARIHVPYRCTMFVSWGRATWYTCLNDAQCLSPEVKPGYTCLKDAQCLSPEVEPGYTCLKDARCLSPEVEPGYTCLKDAQCLSPEVEPHDTSAL